jgi:hypothetical protein
VLLEARSQLPWWYRVPAGPSARTACHCQGWWLEAAPGCSSPTDCPLCSYAPVLAGGKAVNTTDVRWDATQQSPFFNYRATDGSIHQVRPVPCELLSQAKVAPARDTGVSVRDGHRCVNPCFVATSAGPL